MEFSCCVLNFYDSSQKLGAQPSFRRKVLKFRPFVQVSQFVQTGHIYIECNHVYSLGYDWFCKPAEVKVLSLKEILCRSIACHEIAV